MNVPRERPRQRGWSIKFRDAFRGVWWAVRDQNSYQVHIAATLAVLAAGWWLRVSRIEWCLLTLCITVVWAAETMNSGIEMLAKEVDREYNPQLGAALDMSSAAVLLAALGSVAVGLIVFVFRLGVQLAWWD